MRVMIEWMRRLLGVAVVGVVCAVVVGPGVCWGQGEEWGEEGARYSKQITDHYTQKYELQLQGLAVLCDLSEAQIEACRSLQEANLNRLVSAYEKVDEYTRFLEQEVSAEKITRAAYSDLITSVNRDVSKHYETLMEELKADLKDLLTDEQLPCWEWSLKLSRFQDHEEWVYGSPTRGDNVFRLVLNMYSKHDVNREMRNILEHYLTEIDRLLSQFESDRNNAAEKWERVQSDPFVTEEERGEANSATQRPGAVLWEQSREVSEATLRRLLPLLPEWEAAEVELRFYETSDYGVDSPIPDLGALCRKVMGIESVTEEQKGQIRAFRLQAVRERVSKLKKRASGQSDAEKRVEDRSDLIVQSTQQLERLRAILTTEQIEEAGPPIKVSVLYVPDFESDDETPWVKIDRSRRHDRMLTMSPIVNAIDVDFLARIAGFSKEQKEAAGNLVAGYELRFRATMRKLHVFELSMMSSLETVGGSDPKIMQQVVRVMATCSAHLKRIRRELLEDLRQILTEEQMPKWEIFECRIVRKSLREGEMFGGGTISSADLPGILDGAYIDGAAPSAEVLEVVESYEREMKPLVAELLSVDQNQMEVLGKAADAEIMDWDEIKRNLNPEQQKFSELMNRVKDVDRQYFMKLSEMMEGEPRMIFEEAMFTFVLGSLMVYRDRSEDVPDAFELAEEIDRLTLTDVQRDRVREIRRGKRKAIHEAQRKRYETFIAIKQEANDHWSSAYYEVGQTEPMQLLIAQIDDLHDSMVTELLAVLTPEQVGRLPKKWRQQEKVPYPRFDED